MEGIFETCRTENPDDGFDALECVTNGLNNGIADLNNGIADLNSKVDCLSEGVDVFFTIFLSIIMFIMQAGFGMLCAGSVRRKNVQNTLLKHFLDA
jgi:X-X-X-Leu-X-X-Gly heptad repeat protein